ncbi:GumC family protein [Actibacterium lipolyticum]|uniref:Tyrosine-protein kinase etk n=1 Tax=Actibacterium lipolyticum TaxID=1524263 RepID=A0A238KZ20_9RHOB|nr:polysaccharide biosynthesis tyrosine autokinase [Actibacterium lipolyticum]SMX47316.1 Tyrosine-protein kinase etk [Actibacterium lipolyticum]
MTKLSATPPRISLQNTAEQNGGVYSNRPSERIGMEDIWLILRRNLMMMVTIILTGMLVAAVVVLSRDKVYNARATIVLNPADTRVKLSSSQLESVDLTRAAVETEIDVLRSREFAWRVARSLELMENRSFNPFITVEDPPGRAEQRDLVLKKLLSTYAVFRSGESFALDISANYSDPTLAAKIANAVAGEYIAQSLAEKQSDATNSIEFLHAQISSIEQSLSEKEAEVATYIRASNLDDNELSAKLRAELERLKAIHELQKSGQGQGTPEELEQLGIDLAEKTAALEERTRAELRLLILERALETERNRYQSLVGRLSDIEAQSNILVPGARQVTFAEAPQSPSSPNIKTAMAFSFVGLVGLSFLLAFLLEGLDRRVWNEKHTIRVTGLPNLGYIPRVDGLGRDADFQPAQYIKDNPRSAFVESLRALFTLLTRSQKTRQSPIIMISSGLPNEGKSTIAVSLSVSTANERRRVLLIDFDIHRQGASKMLDLPKVDLRAEDVLTKKVPLSASIQSETGIENLHCLTFKRDSGFPSWLFNDPECHSTLDELREEYDLIIIDTPPILIVDDASRLASVADEALLVARWGETTEDILRDAAERLRQIGVTVTGTVITDVDVTKQRRYGYGGYASYYAYGKDYY